MPQGPVSTANKLFHQVELTTSRTINLVEIDEDFFADEQPLLASRLCGDVTSDDRMALSTGIPYPESARSAKGSSPAL